MSFHKYTILSEFLIYKWFKNQSWLLPLLNATVKTVRTVKINEICIELPLGIPVSFRDNLNSVMSVLLSGIFSLYYSGYIYGDVKMENMVSKDGKYYMIDFDSVFPTELSKCRTQTYNMYEDPEKDLCWALGFFVYRWSFPFCDSEILHKNYKTSFDIKHVQGEWMDFVKKSRTSKTLETLLSDIPYPIIINKVNIIPPPFLLTKSEQYLESLTDFKNARNVSSSEEEAYYSFANLLCGLSDDNVLVSIVAMWRVTAFTYPMDLGHGIYHTCYFENEQELFKVATEALKIF